MEEAETGPPRLLRRRPRRLPLALPGAARPASRRPRRAAGALVLAATTRRTVRSGRSVAGPRRRRQARHAGAYVVLDRRGGRLRLFRSGADGAAHPPATRREASRPGAGSGRLGKLEILTVDGEPVRGSALEDRVSRGASALATGWSLWGAEGRRLSSALDGCRVRRGATHSEDTPQSGARESPDANSTLRAAPGGGAPRRGAASRKSRHNGKHLPSSGFRRASAGLPWCSHLAHAHDRAPGTCSAREPLAQSRSNGRAPFSRRGRGAVASTLRVVVPSPTTVRTATRPGLLARLRPRRTSAGARRGG